MPFDLGDVVTLPFQTFDAATGGPANAGTVTITITQPDMSVVGPTTVAPSLTGLYSYQFTPTMAGRHIARWVAAAPNASAYADAFDVSPADPGYLISLADAKTALRLTGTKDDDELRLFLEATTDIVENFVGTVLPRSFTEQHDGGAQTIVLYHQPVLAVQSLTVIVGNMTWTLTNQPPGQSTDFYGFSLDDAEGGRITRRGSASIPMQFEGGPGGISVTYTAGRPVIPPGIKLAAQIILQHLWRTQRASMPASNRNDGDTAIPVSMEDLPSYAITLLERFEQVPGFA
jgi:hypothetical protein